MLQDWVGASRMRLVAAQADFAHYVPTLCALFTPQCFGGPPALLALRDRAPVFCGLGSRFVRFNRRSVVVAADGPNRIAAPCLQKHLAPPRIVNDWSSLKPFPLGACADHYAGHRSGYLHWMVSGETRERRKGFGKFSC